MVLLWGWTDLGDRIRTGDVVSDPLRPLHPVTSYLVVDLGRAAFASVTRFVVPVLIGATLFRSVSAAAVVNLSAVSSRVTLLEPTTQ